jgi:hypothetical protein
MENIMMLGSPVVQLRSYAVVLLAVGAVVMVKGVAHQALFTAATALGVAFVAGSMVWRKSRQQLEEATSIVHAPPSNVVLESRIRTARHTMFITLVSCLPIAALVLIGPDIVDGPVAGAALAGTVDYMLCARRLVMWELAHRGELLCEVGTTMQCERKGQDDFVVTHRKNVWRRLMVSAQSRAWRFSWHFFAMPEARSCDELPAA